MSNDVEHAPPHWLDPIIDAYKKDIDRTLIRENLKLTPEQRLENLQSLVEGLEEVRLAMQRAKSHAPAGAK